MSDESYSFNSWNEFWCCSVQAQTVCFAERASNGSVNSARFGMKVVRCVIMPRNERSSLAFAGGRSALIADSLNGSDGSPCAESTSPMYVTDDWKNLHLSRFTVIPWARSLARVLLILCNISGTVSAPIMMLSEMFLTRSNLHNTCSISRW